MAFLEPDFTSVAALLGEPVRVAMCRALLDDRSRLASELARAAGVSARTANQHLDRLIAAGVVQVEQQGRRLYYQLVPGASACVVEARAAIVAQNRTLGADGRREVVALFTARTCYRHLAGRLGVALAEALTREGWLADEDGGYRITPEGIALLDGLGIAASTLRRRGQPVARRCLDWSERRPHVAGPLGTALADLAITRDWVRRQQGTRAVLLTPLGRSEFQRIFRVRFEASGPRD